MQIDILRRMRRLRLVWAGAFLVIVSVAIGLLTTGAAIEDRVRLSLQARAEIGDFYYAMAEAEKAQRAYVLTGDSDYLADFQLAESRLETFTSRLEALASSRALSPEDIDEIIALSVERGRQFDAVLQAYEREGLSAAVAAIKGNDVRQTTARIHDLVDLIDEEENQLLHEAQEQAALVRTLLLTALLLVFAGAVGATAIRLEDERRVAQTLLALNEDLEAKVAERTVELERERRRVEHILADMSHRIGNNLALLSSSLLLEARGSSEQSVRDLLTQVSERIVGIGMAQRRLYAETKTGMVEVSSYLGMIVRDLTTAVEGQAIAIRMRADTLQFPCDRAVAIGVIVNELATNAFKHAFPDGSGTLEIELTTDGSEVTLSVADDGGGVTGQDEASIGSMIVRSMVGALGGRVLMTRASQDAHRPGTKWTIRFPSAVREAPGFPQALVHQA